MSLATLVVNLIARTDQYEQPMKKAKRTLSEFDNGFQKFEKTTRNVLKFGAGGFLGKAAFEGLGALADATARGEDGVQAMGDAFLRSIPIISGVYDGVNKLAQGLSGATAQMEKLDKFDKTFAKYAETAKQINADYRLAIAGAGGKDAIEATRAQIAKEEKLAKLASNRAELMKQMRNVPKPLGAVHEQEGSNFFSRYFHYSTKWWKNQFAGQTANAESRQQEVDRINNALRLIDIEEKRLNKTEKIVEANKKTEQAQKDTEKWVEAWSKDYDNVAAKADQIKESLMTPMEKFKQYRLELERLVSYGMLEQSQMDAALKSKMQELMEKDKPKTGEAAVYANASFLSMSTLIKSGQTAPLNKIADNTGRTATEISGMRGEIKQLIDGMELA